MVHAGRPRTPHLNLVHKLAGYMLLASILPLLFVGAFSYGAARDAVAQQATQYVSNVVVGQRDYLDVDLQAIDSLADNISSVEDIINSLDDSTGQSASYNNLATQARIGYILNGYANLKGLASIDVFTVGGAHYHVGDTLNIDNIRADLRNEFFAEAVGSDRQLIWTGIEDNVNANSSYRKVVTAIRMLSKTDRTSLRQRPVALLVINYDADQLREHFATVDMGEGATVMVIDPKNRLVYHPDRSLVGAQVSDDFAADLKGEGGAFTDSLDGQDTFVAYSRSVQTGFVVVGLIPTSTLVAPAGVIGTATTTVLGFSLVVATVAAFALTRSIVTPIRQITRRFRATQEGSADWSDPLPERAGSDEIADLVKWFNAFLSSVKARDRAEADLRQRTNELSRANAELARAARLKDEFLASMSHELRTPLTAILGLTEALQVEVYGPLSDRQRSSLCTIAESGRHLLDLINDILDLSKIEAGKLDLQVRPVRVDDLCQASLRFVKQIARQKRIAVDYDSDLPAETTMVVDERRVKQILVNLLNNAVKFTPDGGSVGLRVREDVARDAVVFTVWDTGIGISREEMVKLFRPFVQLDSRLSREYSGTGLGLSLVQRMTELHGGSVSLESEVGRGSAFGVTLPKGVSAASAPSGAAPSQPPAASRRHSPSDEQPVSLDSPLILLADDNETIVRTVSDFLGSRGCRVAVARDGREAVELARALRPHLILMDIQMPKLDGLEATRQVKDDPATAAIPVIALTALAMTGDRERCLRAGAVDYLSKPVSLLTLVRKIAQHLDSPLTAALTPAAAPPNANGR